MWSSLPGSSSLSPARRATHICSPSGRRTSPFTCTPVARMPNDGSAPRSIRAKHRPVRARRGHRTPRRASGSSPRSASARAMSCKRRRLGQGQRRPGSLADRRKAASAAATPPATPSRPGVPPMQERQPRARQDSIVAGAHMPLKSGLFRVLSQSVRLSKMASSCHMRGMRRSSVRSPPADLPPALQVQRSTLQTVAVPAALSVAGGEHRRPDPGGDRAAVHGRWPRSPRSMCRWSTAASIDALAPKDGAATAARRADGADPRLRPGAGRRRPGSANCATRCSPRSSSAPCGCWRCAPSAICTRSACASISTARPAACRG